jgi:hypothetical protein
VRRIDLSSGPQCTGLLLVGGPDVCTGHELTLEVSVRGLRSLRYAIGNVTEEPVYFEGL